VIRAKHQAPGTDLLRKIHTVRSPTTTFNSTSTIPSSLRPLQINMGSDPLYAKYPDLSLSQDIFNLSNPSCAKATQLSSLKKLQDVISEHKMAPLYWHLAHPVDGVLNKTGEGPPPPQNHSSSGRKLSVVSSNMLARKNALKIDLSWDEKLYDSLQAENEKELEAMQKEEDEAVEKAGETEIQAVRGKRAEFWARVGDKVDSALNYVSADTNMA
jgi:26S proteasome regulatory subunit N7